MAHSIGSAIRKLREQRGLTQERLAILARVSRTTVIGVERGQNTKRSTLTALAEALDTDVHALESAASGDGESSAAAPQGDEQVKYFMKLFRRLPVKQQGILIAFVEGFLAERRVPTDRDEEDLP